MHKGAHNYHKALYEKLIRYLQSQYLGRSEVLLEACRSLLTEQENGLYSEPYIESSPAYETVKNGIAEANLPCWLKDFFEEMIRMGLGVYRDAFRHQVEALELAWRGSDFLVSTGTGSGKTECFMWPLIAKLAREAKENPESWQNQRGIRAMIMYPMNALVSDQIGRLRRLLGDKEGKFIHAFRAVAGENTRRPQFGMYTGRTPYPGAKPDKGQDKDLAGSLERVLARENDDAYFQELLAGGKIPAKAHLKAFIENIRKHEHHPNPEDAEMVTRFEMQEVCPDILITNYSMLEYMLLRPREESLWKETRAWLDRNPDEKLLFIIDEAHMYRGSSGGEVALLLRRLFHKLGITRDRVQFILTTASMPHDSVEDEKVVREFAGNLTAAASGHFQCLWGYHDETSPEERIDIPVEVFNQVEIGMLDANEMSCLQELEKFRRLLGHGELSWQDLKTARQWLYTNLTRYAPFQDMFKACRGKAVSISELANTLFPKAEKVAAAKAIDVMLAIAPMAHDATTGSILFPARMHMMFRGFHGVYACANPGCPGSHEKNGVALGDVQLVDSRLTCSRCGSMVYELHNDRRCGALFFRGYVQETVGKQYLWRTPGAFFERDELHEVHFYLPMGDEPLPDKNNARHPFRQCYLDYSTGYLTFDDFAEGKDGYRRLWYSNYVLKGRPNLRTFSRCPKCRQMLSNARITNISTRGNEPFYNVIQEQFMLQQPAQPKERDERFPNEGRKVLLFSDSRQRAAVLARDMSQSSDTMAVRQLFMLALKKMNEIQPGDRKMLTLNDSYAYFVQAAMEHNVSLFSNESRKTFEGHKAEIRDSLDYEEDCPLHELLTFNDAPPEMQEHLLRMFCSRYNSLYDAGLCYFEPRRIPPKVKQLGKPWHNDETFLEIFHAISCVFLQDDVALGPQFNDNRRRVVRPEYRPFGHDDFTALPTTIAEVLGLKDDTRMQMQIMDVFKSYCGCGDGDTARYFLQPDKIRPVYDPEHTWYRCGRCASLTAFMLQNHCPVCGDAAIRPENDFSAEAFWREASQHALDGNPIRVLNTEEHTAQLGHKDQRSEIWAKTEQHEMRFQDMLREEEQPVDVLSCTTTMEVGIDIGSLLAVGLRNMPPMRENYQQRAGRAGRRGASLSTIVTFIEGGPHDTYYFKNPGKMFSGTPRRPWIDVNNRKLLTRHLSMIVLNAFMQTISSSLDEISTFRFFGDHLDNFRNFLQGYTIDSQSQRTLLPKTQGNVTEEFKGRLTDALDALHEKVQNHPDAYGDKEGKKKQKPLLDALYEEGVIPTYSFPKDVVSVYIEDAKGKILYQPDRSLDIALNEYAPGREIVVDKKTYRIGGIYLHKKYGNIFTPAQDYFNDKNHHKELVQCQNCKWFGFPQDTKNGKCPFCSHAESIVPMDPMLRPWGFSPLQTTTDFDPGMTYTSSGTPLYSSLPDKPMDVAPGCCHMRMATRENERIIMLNRGIVDREQRGFVVCERCGAAAVGSGEEDFGKVLKGIRRPGNVCQSSCNHSPKKVNLGYDFLTDMLVLEIKLPKDKIETTTKDAELWREHAATTLAEALRLSTSRILDIEFTDIVAGHRTRWMDNHVFLDVYLYDSLSSGAGYSSRIALYIEELLAETKKLLTDCDCQRACHHCLKHYRNQFLHPLLDRRAGRQLLEWGMSGELPGNPQVDDLQKYFQGIAKILAEEYIEYEIEASGGIVRLTRGTITAKCRVLPAMKKIPLLNDEIHLTVEALEDAKPFAIGEIRKIFGLSGKHIP